MDPVSQEDFAAEVLQTPGKVVVDFWADWCGPCRMITPVLEELEDEYPDIKFVKVNVDDDPGLAQRYDVMSIPTVLAIENGQVRKHIVGALPKAKLLDELSDWLA